ncbi:MAG: CoA pyrophosphatase, partial [Rhodobacteraceae bacterium]|nr:CoA pyrophosphatase [Paracoccaceae bacterium]
MRDPQKTPAPLREVGISTLEFQHRFETSRTGSGFLDGGGDHILNDGFARHQSAEYKDAAVLFGVIERSNGAHVLFTKRTETLSSHKGQVALPGGRIDESDETPESAALRETHEEVGIGSSEVTILGRLGDYLSGSGYRIKPVVGIIDPGFTLMVNEHEVAEVFEVPLAFLMDRANHHIGSAIWD